MRLLNERVITRFAKSHPDCREWLEGWVATTRAAQWRTIQDVKQSYPAADGGVKVKSGLVVTIFDVGGNKYRLITRINYAIQTVDILELMTHAEYSKNRWKQRH